MTHTQEKITVAWCPVHQWWFPSEDIGNRCPEDSYCNRKLIKRVGYLCAAEGLHRTKREARECQDDHV